MAASSSSTPDPSCLPIIALQQQQHPHQHQQHQQQQQHPSPSSSRRLPPPCWTHDETVALIDSYREKWYSLRRGNLRASHWQEVADEVARLCPLITPSKTSVQCRHKIEKLRKRYRTEKQRALTVSITPNSRNRYSSSWVFFKKMDSMEKGPSSSLKSDSSENEDDNDDDDDNDEQDNPNTRSVHRPMGNGVSNERNRGGFRLRIPGKGASSVPPITSFGSKSYGRVDENPSPGFDYSGFFNGCSSSKSGLGSVGGGSGGGSKREMDPVAEMVSSIKLFGDGLVKMEQMKIQMAREIEKMRMEMELKRTEMILETQQRIVDAFTRGLCEKKKKFKRMPSPDS